MSKVFVFNFDRCNGCYSCQVVCKDEHCEQAWPPYTASQPLIGQFWFKLTEKVRGQVPVVRVSYEPVICGHCADAPCLNAGGDAVYRREDGLVIIDPEKSKGKKELVDSCPIGAIYYNDELDIAQKCTGCAHLLDNGWEVPRCVDACPTEALLYVEESEIDLSEAEIYEQLAGFGPKVYLLNKPKRFVAGTVVDFSIDEALIGTKVELVDQTGTTVATEITDEFGDFKFDQIEKAVYTVVIGEKNIPADVTEIDLCVGDIAIN